MNDKSLVIWFWQQIVSPHMAGLAAALVRQGCEVTYVAEKLMSESRERQGWTLPDLGGARLMLAPSSDAVRELVNAVSPNSIHICQGIRGNGLVGCAQRILAQRGLRQWVVMETVDDVGWLGVLKRLEYRRLFSMKDGRIEGVLATGHQTPRWLVNRGVSPKRVFPFTYYLPDPLIPITPKKDKSARFRFIFVGQFIPRKRLDLLVSALTQLNPDDIELAVIGSGPLESELRHFAEEKLPKRVIWHGRLPIHDVQQLIADADCLVLPSRYDGWGAVVSEALIVGTPVICSDRCGSAGAAQASGHGGVFRSGDISGLVVELKRMLSVGRLAADDRKGLAEWGKSLCADAGASYLRSVLEHSIGQLRPAPPLWGLK